MSALAFLLAGVLLLGGLAAWTDAPAARAVRAAAQAVRDTAGEPYQVRAAAARDGWLAGYATVPATPRRTTGRSAPPPGAVAAAATRLARGAWRMVTGRPACPHCRDTTTGDPCAWCTGDTTLMVSAPDTPARYLPHAAGDPLPALAAGERLDRLDRRTCAATPITVPAPPAGRAPARAGNTEATTKEIRMSVTQLPARTTTPPTTGRAIESLPDYRRYLTGAHTAAVEELEDAQAGAARHQALAIDIAEGVARLMALEVDRVTTAEGGRVSEAAQVAREASDALARALADLVDTIRVATDGATRHDAAQEIHDAGVLAQKPAYAGQ